MAAALAPKTNEAGLNPLAVTGWVTGWAELKADCWLALARGSDEAESEALEAKGCAGLVAAGGGCAGTGAAALLMLPVAPATFLRKSKGDSPVAAGLAVTAAGGSTLPTSIRETKGGTLNAGDGS